VNVFILSAGRVGSKSFASACQYITNYTAGHESRIDMLADDKTNYPTFHIESDNRLSWLLGRLEKKYGNDAVYVHLVREPEEVADSYNNRWSIKGGIVKAYSSGILMQSMAKNNIETCMDYVETVNLNIESFLIDKDKKMKFYLDAPGDSWTVFWELIEAEGDFDLARHSWFIEKQNKRKRISMYRSLCYRLAMLLDRVERCFGGG